MELVLYAFIFYLLIINLITLIVYFKEINTPSPRFSPIFFIVLPLLGGSIGAILANYIKDVEHKELRASIAKIVAFLPPVIFITQILIIISIFCNHNLCLNILNYINLKFGLIGLILLAINIFSFVFIAIRKYAYYIAPIGNNLIPDYILTPVILLGGATGALAAKIIFNFKEDWSCNTSMKFQNFLYNKGMYVIFILQIIIFYIMEV